jgi:hypothetical protein
VFGVEIALLIRSASGGTDRKFEEQEPGRLSCRRKLGRRLFMLVEVFFAKVAVFDQKAEDVLEGEVRFLDVHGDL